TFGLAVLQELGMDEHLGLGAELAVSFAEKAVAAEIAVFQAAPEAWVGNAQVRLELDQLGGLVVVVVIYPAQLLSQEPDPAIGVDDLGLEVRVFQVAAARDCAVVGQQDRIRVLHVGKYGVRERLPARSLIGGDRHLAEEDFELGKDAFGNRLLSHG